MLIVFIGPPGAGKGTQAEKLTSHMGIGHLSTGDALREAKRSGSELGKQVAGYIDRGDLVPDELVVDIVGERLARPDCRKGCLFDGFPRTLPQAEALDHLLEKRGQRLDAVIELACDEKELTERLLKRAEIEGRADDTPETIAHRQETYRRQTAPLLDYYRRRGVLRVVNGMQTPEEVFEDIRRVIDDLTS